MRRFVSLLRPAPLVLALSLVAHGGGRPAARATADRSEDVAAALRELGLESRAADVGWVDEPAGALSAPIAERRALVLARAPRAKADVWLVRARLSPEGRVVELASVHNVTRTSAAEEHSLAVAGERAAWLAGSEGAVYRVELADLSGERAARTDEWTRLARAQHALTNLQKTGQLSGIERRSFKLDPVARDVRLTWSPSSLDVVADGHAIRVPVDPSRPISGERFVREQERVLAPPGNLVTWAVDRVRETSWFGDERMQLLKAVAFAALDRAARLAGTVLPDTSAEEIAEETAAWTSQPAVHESPEIGWPPPPLTPVLSQPIEREGQWNALSDDAFFLKNPGAPPPFVTTFIRTDGDRPLSRIFVALWDPRQVDLHMVPGTEEPVSATGEMGTGIIPREPRVLERLLAAFNGGFQSTHGDYGMMVDRDVLVPPKPYAATVAVLSDGSLGFGTWPADVTVDTELVSFRQNLTPLLLDDRVNPYKRTWWGGVPQDWEDETRTVRSGLCLTKESFIAYFYGAMVDHEHLALAMRAARCTYGLHLDMNQGHTGLEFYRVAKEGELPKVDRKLDPVWEAEDAVKGAEGYRFRGRRLIKNMQLMHFPRYIRRGQRDFFYLTLKHTLPGEPIAVSGTPEAGEGVFRTEGLPQYGWPPALATTWVRPDPRRPETKVYVVKLDPKLVAIGNPPDSERTLLSLSQAHAPGGDTMLWLHRNAVELGPARPAPGAVALATVSSSPLPETQAAVGVGLDGMLIYAEVATARNGAADGQLLAALLDTLGCTAKGFSREPLGVAIGGRHDLAGHPAAETPNALRLIRARTPSARRIFSETPVLAPADWQPLQQQTRFFDSDDTGSPTQ